MSALAQSEPAGPRSATVQPAAAKVNADKVDGKHAVGAGASPSKRAGKLVATDSAGRLPSDIVQPGWDAIKGKPAGFADGSDDVGYFSGIQFDQTDPLAAGGTEVVTTHSWDPGYQVFWQAIPGNSGEGTAERLLLTHEIERQADGKLLHWLTVKNNGSSPTTYKLRYVAIYMGVAPASKAAKRDLAAVETRLRRSR